MIVAFFESIKYVGHMLPVALLRIYLGYYFLDRAIWRFEGDFLLQPRLASAIEQWLPNSSAPEWYKNILDHVVVPNWQLFAYTITYFDFLIGVSFLLGFLVRPVAILGALIAINFIYNSSPEMVEFYKLHLAIFIVFAWLGAGRCLGLDYFFFKRKRGLWW